MSGIGGLGNIMNFFSGGGSGGGGNGGNGGNNATPPQQQAPANSAPQADHSTLQGLNNNGNPQNQNSGQQHQPASQNNPGQQQQQESASPLDQYKDLFKIEVDSNAPADDPNASWFNLDQEKMLEAANKVSFTNVPQFSELASKALNGDVEAFGSLLDNVMRSAYVRNAMLAGTISEKAGRAALDKISATLPDRVKDINSSEGVAKLNPMFQHAAMKPMVDMVRSQIQRKYPDATSSQITEMTNQYLTTISAQLQTKPEEPADHRKVDHVAGSDFSSFFS